jgi:hypothetical protein
MTKPRLPTLKHLPAERPRCQYCGKERWLDLVNRKEPPCPRR